MVFEKWITFIPIYKMIVVSFIFYKINLT